MRKVTEGAYLAEIANQANTIEIANLQQQVEQLRHDRDQLNLVAANLADVQAAYIRLQGWQDCAREVMGTADAKTD